MSFLHFCVSASLNLQGSRPTSISETESEWRNESTIVCNPHLPAIAEEGNKFELKFSDLVEENEFDLEEEESVFGPPESTSTIKVNLGATDEM